MYLFLRANLFDCATNRHILIAIGKGKATSMLHQGLHTVFSPPRSHEGHEVFFALIIFVSFECVSHACALIFFLLGH